MDRALMPSIFLSLLVASCGGGNAVNPYSESVPAHDQAARRNDSEARAHDANYDPNARVVENCNSPPGPAPESPCWASIMNPTDTEREQAAEHRRVATEHRAASQLLRDAEARACVGVAESDRDLCPLMHREDISGVTRLEEPGARGGPPQLVGAIVKFRDIRGLDLAWLERILNCHAAQAAAYGEGFENPSCPLVLRGVTVQITQSGDGFLVSLRASDPAEAATVLARAQELVTPQTT